MTEYIAANTAVSAIYSIFSIYSIYCICPQNNEKGKYFRLNIILGPPTTPRHTQTKNHHDIMTHTVSHNSRPESVYTPFGRYESYMYVFTVEIRQT